MNRSAVDKLQIVTSMKFPTDSYPVLYPSFWSDNLEDTYKLENNINGGVILDPVKEVYKTYYNLILDINTLSQITYDNTRTPYPVIFVIRYQVHGKERYLWEYYNNWMDIKALNTTKYE